jgi:RHS repeat-associated protein
LRTQHLTNVGGVALGWDAAGHVPNRGARSLRCHHTNRLQQLTEGSQTTQFAYNGDGVRVGKTIGASATDYLLDLAATLPVVISDTDAVYLYGLDIIAEQLAGAERYYYVHDGLGSVRHLVDSTGQIETRYAYDPFGVPLAGNGVSNPWQFTGEAWDAGVELLYLRARYYQPGTGRFITKDPWPGDLWRPGTLNPYVYVGNNPVNLLDPTGFNNDEPPPQPHIVGRSEWGALKPGRHGMYVKACKIESGWAERVFHPKQGGTWYGYARYSDLYYFSGLYDERPFDLADVLHTIVIHHEGNYQTYDVRAVQWKHVFGGLRDIGYHYAVARAGIIYEGRNIGVRGAHVRGANSGMVGVLWLGDFHPDLEFGGGRTFPIDWDDPGPSRDQIESTVQLVRWLDYLYGIDRVIGHRDLPGQGTPCPRRRVTQRQIGELNRVAQER